MLLAVVYTLYQFNVFLILSGIPSTEETMSSLLTVIQSSSQSQLGSQQYSECPVSEWNSGGNSNTSATSSNGQVGSVCFLLSRKSIRANSSRVLDLKSRHLITIQPLTCCLPSSHVCCLHVFIHWFVIVSILFTVLHFIITTLRQFVIESSIENYNSVKLGLHSL